MDDNPQLGENMLEPVAAAEGAENSFHTGQLLWLRSWKTNEYLRIKTPD